MHTASTLSVKYVMITVEKGSKKAAGAGYPTHAAMLRYSGFAFIQPAVSEQSGLRATVRREKDESPPRLKYEKRRGSVKPDKSGKHG
jgi:hypothetical protein